MDKVGGDEKDLRPWRRVSFDLPDDKANQLEDCLRMAVHYGVASNRIEAIEAICVGFLVEHNLATALWTHEQEKAGRTYKLNSLIATREAGYRCGLCETSKDLEVHHIWAKGCKDPDRPEWVKHDINDVRNLIPLCRKCHNEIQPRYRDYIQQFMLEKERRRQEMYHMGYIQTKKHGKKKVRRWV